MVQYDPPGLDQEKAESVKVYALWAEKDGVARAANFGILGEHLVRCLFIRCLYC